MHNFKLIEPSAVSPLFDVGPRRQESIFVLCHNRRQCSKGRSAFPEFRNKQPNLNSVMFTKMFSTTVNKGEKTGFGPKK